MKLFAIGDLHLSADGNKPMDMFGAKWEHHFEKISTDWRMRVTDEDVVLVPGDISWAMHLNEALPDLEAIGALPGKKVLLRGNHDYWWASLSRLRDILPEGMYVLQNDALQLGDIVLAGSRGWTLPGMGNAEDERIYRREVMRLKLSLEAAQRFSGTLVAMTHFPPVPDSGERTEVSRLLSEYKTRFCVYGHLHGAAGRNAFSGELDGTAYACVACDQIDFKLFQIPVLSGDETTLKPASLRKSGE